MKIVLKLLIIIITIPTISFSQIPYLNTLISDTLFIKIKNDSLVDNFQNNYNISDIRKYSDNVIGITQINKYKYFPVDQYLFLNHSISNLLGYKLASDSINFQHKLIIEDINLWNDTKSFFKKARILSGYSYLVDENDNKTKDWLWEIRYKNKKKLEIEENLSNIFDTWLSSQTDSLKYLNFNTQIYPYKYRRVLESWFDFILLPDGFIINGNLTLNFPQNHKNKWFLGSAGMYYRKSSYHESFTVGGFDQHWFKRFSPTIVWRNNSTFRFGINSFNHEKFEHVDYWNILMLNLGFSSSFEYRPKIFRGLFCGGGLYLNINGLPYIPEKIKIVEPGIFTTIGICLP